MRARAMAIRLEYLFHLRCAAFLSAAGYPPPASKGISDNSLILACTPVLKRLFVAGSDRDRGAIIPMTFARETRRLCWGAPLRGSRPIWHPIMRRAIPRGTRPCGMTGIPDGSVSTFLHVKRAGLRAPSSIDRKAGRPALWPPQLPACQVLRHFFAPTRHVLL